MNRMYAVDPEPDSVAFLRRYGQHVRRLPMIASIVDGRAVPAQGPLLHEALGLGDGRLGLGKPLLPLPQVGKLAISGRSPRAGSVGQVADARGRGLHSAHPQGWAARTPEHPLAHEPVHGLPAVGRGALGGCDRVAGIPAGPIRRPSASALP